MAVDPRPRRKRFGQHFLHDAGIVKRIVTAIDPAAAHHVVEIGPGGGALTKSLAQAAPRLTAVEIDRDLAAWLRVEFADTNTVAIVEADALRFDLQSLGRDLVVVGNLPYNISTPLLFRLTDARAAIRKAIFMLQREVVERIVAQPGTKTYGRLSVMLQCYWDTRALFTVPAGAFSPPPKVASAVVALHSRQPVIEPSTAASFESIVRTAFSQRRKTLRRSLNKLMSAEAIQSAGVDPGARPETLAVEDFARLSLPR
ncbi:MAG: 16S rRNA (adenine(1518)-N(6)/adenine(1519)-N(6))-dimethyltransferase RsmA [Pseudomonadota bacterium]